MVYRAHENSRAFLYCNDPHSVGVSDLWQSDNASLLSPVLSDADQSLCVRLCRECTRSGVAPVVCHPVLARLGWGVLCYRSIS